ncbi:hypothetical protein [Paenibacillus sp. CMAA1364]
MDDIRQAVSGLFNVKDQYVWNYFQDIESLEDSRLKALHDCVNHMKLTPKVYVPCNLPKLPFEDKRFDITLSAHFLFTYADRLDFEFHLNTIKELLRVSKKEVRLFPLVDLKSNKYSELEPLLEFIHNQGWKSEERIVDYEFQRNANSMLRIYKDL